MKIWRIVMLAIGVFGVGLVSLAIDLHERRFRPGFRRARHLRLCHHQKCSPSAPQRRRR